MTVTLARRIVAWIGPVGRRLERGPIVYLKTRNITQKMVKARKFVLVKHFEGEPKESDLEIQEETLPALKDGEILVEALWLSVDPYMRAYVSRGPTGITMIGSQVAKVIESRSKDYPVGANVVGQYGWRTHTVVDTTPGKETTPGLANAFIIDKELIAGLPLSLLLGVLGMPGNTAYFGFLELCKPKAGETVVVSGAAGAVGSLVGQIAKIKGCKVIGFAGSQDKCDWLTKELGFDSAFNYKTKDVSEALREAAPKGVDCYFDNVGGEMSSAILNQMNPGGRISVCGSISSYNADVKAQPKASIIQPAMVFKGLKMEGFIVHRWLNRWLEGIKANSAWIKGGKLIYREHVTNGFDNMTKAFIGMLRGENTGKAVVKA